MSNSIGISGSATQEAKALIKTHGIDKAIEVARMYQAISRNTNYWQYVAATIERQTAQTVAK